MKKSTILMVMGVEIAIGFCIAFYMVFVRFDLGDNFIYNPTKHDFKRIQRMTIMNPEEKDIRLPRKTEVKICTSRFYSSSPRWVKFISWQAEVEFTGSKSERFKIAESCIKDWPDCYNHNLNPQILTVSVEHALRQYVDLYTTELLTIKMERKISEDVDKYFKIRGISTKSNIKVLQVSIRYKKTY